MRILWRRVPATHSFITLERRLRAFARVRELYGGGTGPLPEELLSRAERIAVELLASAPHERVLHGDLHHDNIVSAQRAPWLAIDPKGVVGDPGFETGALMNNPYGRMETWTEPARQFDRRPSRCGFLLGARLVFRNVFLKNQDVAKRVAEPKSFRPPGCRLERERRPNTTTRQILLIQPLNIGDAN